MEYHPEQREGSLNKANKLLKMNQSKNLKNWYVYIVRCSDNSLYTGIALDVDKRLAEHNGKGAAKYTRSRQPVTLVYTEVTDSRSAASSREIAIKKLSKQEKEVLIKLKLLER